MTVTRLQFVVDCSFHAQVLLFLTFYSKVKRGHFIYPKRPFWLVCYAWLKRTDMKWIGQPISSVSWQIAQPNKDQKREGDLFKYSLLDNSFHIITLRKLARPTKWSSAARLFQFSNNSWSIILTKGAILEHRMRRGRWKRAQHEIRSSQPTKP